MRVLDIAAAKRRAVELIDAAELGEPITMSDLVGLFGATACFELFLQHRQDPSDARFVRASLDKLVNIEYVATVDIKPPAEIACALCKERGRIVEHDRQVICPRCAGKGKHYPPDTDTIVVLSGPAPSTTAGVRDVTTINFSKEAAARDFFERVATRIEAMPRPAWPSLGMVGGSGPTGNQRTVDAERAALEAKVPAGLTKRGSALVPTPDPLTAPTPPAYIADATANAKPDPRSGIAPGLGGPVSSRTPWNEPEPNRGADGGGIPPEQDEPAGTDPKGRL